MLRDKFRWPDDDIEMAQREIASFANHVSPQRRLTVVATDPDDDRIVECALEAGSDYIVTSDKHLLRMGSYGPVKMVKPTDFLTIAEPRPSAENPSAARRD